MEREKLVKLVRAGQRGDDRALNALFNAYYNDVYFFALKTVKNEDLACDITQDTFIKIIQCLDELKEPAAFVTWMKQITYHECMRYFKKKKDVLVDEDEDGNTIFDTLAEDRAEFIPGEVLDQEDFRKTILSMLDQLSAEQRAATMLYYYDELSVKQIAEIQGVSEGTVKSRLNYARKAIKASVEDYEKKHDVKLHSFGFFPLFVWLFSASEGAVPAAVAVGMAQAVSAGTGVAIALSGTASGAAAAAAAVAGTGAAVGAAANTGFFAALSSTALTTKLLAGVVAASMALGGTVIAAEVEERKSEALQTESSVVQEFTEVPTELPEETVLLQSTEAAPTETAVAETTPGQTEPVPTETEPRPTETQPKTTETTETTPEETQLPATEAAETEPSSTEPKSTEPVITEPATTQPPVTGPMATEPAATEAPVSANIVPAGCTYILADGTTIEAGGAMPETVASGHEFITEDYTYTYASGGWGVKVNDTTQTSYAALLSQINGAPVTSLVNAFRSCSNMTVAPAIPASVTNLQNAYRFCSSLQSAPAIPSGVTTISHAFYNCTALIAAPTIPTSVTNMSGAFYGCTSLQTAPTIPASVTDMGGTFLYCSALTGEIVIHATPSSYTNCFSATRQPITLTGSGSNLAELAATAGDGNVTVAVN